jgi:hypothetical protein
MFETSSEYSAIKHAIVGIKLHPSSFKAVHIPQLVKDALKTQVNSRKELSRVEFCDWNNNHVQAPQH